MGAARDGVDVRILVPSRNDHPWVSLLTRRYYRRLLTNGVRIWEWQGEMMHAKTSVVDGRWVRVGSTDFNPLGVAINYELDAVIEDPDARRAGRGDVPRRSRALARDHDEEQEASAMTGVVRFVRGAAAALGFAASVSSLPAGVGNGTGPDTGRRIVPLFTYRDAILAGAFAVDGAAGASAGRALPRPTAGFVHAGEPEAAGTRDLRADHGGAGLVRHRHHDVRRGTSREEREARLARAARHRGAARGRTEWRA